MILHARGRTCRTSDDAMSAKSLHRLIERLGKPLAEAQLRNQSRQSFKPKMEGDRHSYEKV